MGNLSHISFNRAVTNKQFAGMLSFVIEKYFGEYYEVISPCPEDTEASYVEAYWVIKPKHSVVPEAYINSYSNYIRRADNYRTNSLYKGKFSYEHSHSLDQYWFMEQIEGYLCTEYNTTLSSDCCDGTRKADPTETPTYREYLCKWYPSCASDAKQLEIYLREVPDGLKVMVGII